MLNYNERMNVLWGDADIRTARNHNALCGLGGPFPPTTDEEQRKIDRLKALRTYGEIKATGTRTPYKDYMRQF